jgi:hypothetical protein
MRGLGLACVPIYALLAFSIYSAGSGSAPVNSSICR